MKTVKRILTALLCVAVVAIGISIPKTASAAAAKTFTIHFDGSDWYFQTNEDSRWMNVASIADFFVAGDALVIDGESQANLKTCNLTIDKYIGEVCAASGATAIVNASAGVGKAYAAYNGITVVNGDVDTVLASGAATVQVNGNVNVLSADYSNGNAKYGIKGTVNKATAKINSETVDTYYSIVAGKMTPDANGIVWLNDNEYSKVAGAAPAATTTQPAGNGAGELDDVPKTGSFTFELSTMLLAAAVILGSASVIVLRKKSK